MHTITLSVIAVMFAVPATAAQECDGRAACRAECEKIEKRISRIHARMRSGYRGPEGERLRSELRRLRERRLKTCR